jgi:signal transduction histidine kinase
MQDVHALFANPAILELMPTAVYIVDEKGLVRGFNKLACEYWGQVPKLYDHDNRFCGAYRLYYPDGRQLHRDASPMAVDWGTTCKNAEVVILRPDGSKITVMVNITPLRDEKEKIVGAINSFQDISELIKARQKIELHQEDLEKRDAFLSICSHELKNPLTVLITQTQLALRKIEKNDESVFDPVRTKIRLQQNAHQFERLNALVDDMLDLHRIETGILKMHFEKFELGQLITDIVQNTVYGADGIKGNITINSVDAMEGIFDRNRIEQMMINLISNAIKYGSDGAIDVEVNRIGKMVQIRVRDRGIGISAVNQKRVFLRYERVSSEQKINGLGIGLYVTKQIVEAHHGKIYIESEIGKGATFVVELPLEQTPLLDSLGDDETNPLGALDIPQQSINKKTSRNKFTPTP